MKKYILLLSMAIFAMLGGCVEPSLNIPGASVDVETARLMGVWKNASTGEYLCLDEDGVLGRPGNASIGLGWEKKGNELFLYSLDTPGSDTRVERFRIDSTGSSLQLTDELGKKVTFRKAAGEVYRIDGEAHYRERMALPPHAVIAATLAQENGTLLACSYKEVENGLFYRLYIPFAELRKAQNPFNLTVTIYQQSDSLFSGSQSVVLDMEQNPFSVPKLLLNRTLPGEATPETIAVPSQFQSADKQVTLYLEQRGLYVLQKASGTTLGHWQQVERNYQLELVEGASAPRVASLRPQGTLLYTSKSSEKELEPVKLALPAQSIRLSGKLTYTADATVLQECASGLNFEVQGSGLPDVQKSLRAVGGKPGEPVFATLDVSLVRRDATKHGAEGWPHVLEIAGAESIIDMGMGKTCPQTYAGTNLQNTYWRLTRIGDAPVTVYPDQPEPHIVLREAKGNAGDVRGNDGCNNFFMPWEQNGAELHFGQGGSTLMLCPQGDAQGRAFLDALSKTTTYQIRGSVLEMRNGAMPLLFFEAVEL